ncbi:zinc metalloproteinase nas-15-like [Watersipora subatra]|uniref:zinc metalloproteinase nas-15-like n=1 Tax=Watersipora subatra TaxID=2589382 RepID=UPI00355C9E75
MRVPKSFHRVKRNAVADKDLLWPNGVVPYTISSKFNSTVKALLRRSMQMIEDATQIGGKKCIAFVPRAGQTSYIHIENYKDCSAELGRRGSARQIVAIGNQCYHKGTIIHELLHTLGFAHEHSRSDRDEFIDVHYENIRQGAEANFKLYADGALSNLGFPYDYDSIMHYESDSFSKRPSSLLTITPKIKLPSGFKLGQRDHLSIVDIEMLRTLYGCHPSEAVKIDSVCEDKLTNCYVYGQSMCTRYPDWASTHCAQTCKICNPPVCEDKLADCHAYEANICTVYKSWSQQNCAKYCGFTNCESESAPGGNDDVTEVTSTPAVITCADKFDCSHLDKSTCSFSHMKSNCPKFCSVCPGKTTPRPTTAPITKPSTTTKGVDDCKDTINDCSDYSLDACAGYPAWANSKCRSYCGLCQTAAISTVATSTSTQQGVCKDTIDDCSEYDRSVCENYLDWSNKNCRSFCGLCEATSTVAPPTTRQQGNCKDQINDCTAYESSVCESYPDWSKTNCQHFCGLCGESNDSAKPACLDTKSDCAEYALEVCTSYASWSRDNCALYCGLCD